MLRFVCTYMEGEQGMNNWLCVNLPRTGRVLPIQVMHRQNMLTLYNAVRDVDLRAGFVRVDHDRQVSFATSCGDFVVGATISWEMPWQVNTCQWVVHDNKFYVITSRVQVLEQLFVGTLSQRADRQRARLLVNLLAVIADGDVYAYVRRRRAYTRLLGQPTLPMPRTHIKLGNGKRVRCWPLFGDINRGALATDDGAPVNSALLTLRDLAWLARTMQHQVCPNSTNNVLLQEIVDVETCIRSDSGDMVLDLMQLELYFRTRGVYVKAVDVDNDIKRAFIKPLTLYIARCELAHVQSPARQRAERLLATTWNDGVYFRNKNVV